MRKPRQPKSVESFGQEIFQALIEGSKREIVLELPYKKAVMFRQRANSLRNAMRESGHEMSRVVAQTTLRILWGKDAGFDDVPETKNSQNVRFPVSKNVLSKLVISPADAEFSAALKKAGVEIKPLVEDPIAAIKPMPSIEPSDEDILSKYLKETPDVQ